MAIIGKAKATEAVIEKITKPLIDACEEFINGKISEDYDGIPFVINLDPVFVKISKQFDKCVDHLWDEVFKQLKSRAKKAGWKLEEGEDYSVTIS